MILLGAYPNSFEVQKSTISPLMVLANILEKVAPVDVCLHLLPFHPSSGDSGFAPENWFEVQHELGTWQDIRTLASQRKLIVDCIYNHVGLGHPSVRNFFGLPDNYADLIYAFQSDTDLSCPNSPRGGPVLRTYFIKGSRWQLWQTFSASAVDIRLDNPVIQKEIDRHLDFLAEQGIWGVRLDGASYYGKRLGSEPHRHHPDAYRLARNIADKALSRNLAVNAQLDCDTPGLQYFSQELGYAIPIVDYSYSAYLAHALLSGDTNAFAMHVKRTWKFPQVLIRCPRTHDGILLRSANLAGKVIQHLLQLAKYYGLNHREIDGSAYEFNCSFPYLCSLGVSEEDMWHRIELAIAVTGFLPGWCYIYLPLLFGYIPEHNHISGSDPRLLNRRPISFLQHNTFIGSKKYSSAYSLLAWLVAFHNTFGDKEICSCESVTDLGSGLLSLKRTNARIQMLANFDTTRSVDVGNLMLGQWVEGRRSCQEGLQPLGFGFWRY